MTVSLIAAVARNGVIGRGNELPWKLSEDLKRFKALTMGHHIIMGRKTWESLGRLLPGRIMVIVSRKPGYAVPGALVVSSLKSALEVCGDDAEVFVIGGAQLYREALPLVDRMYLTLLNADFDGDTHFPPYDKTLWQETAREPGCTADGLSYSFTVYQRQATQST